MAFFRVLIAITVMSEFAMNSVQAADGIFLRSDGRRFWYRPSPRFLV
jgi:hypothetical protein